MAFKCDRDGFVRKAIAVHGDRYVYDQVEYESSKKKVLVLCRKHGEFQVTPGNHLAGRGCRLCKSDLARERYTKKFDVFLAQARRLHGDRYQYNAATYTSALVPMEIVCATHGVFRQRPDSHLRGSGCPRCADIALGVASRTDPSDFLMQCKARFGRKFVFSQTRYERMRSPVTIVCRKHGPFEALPVDFLKSKHGCALCAGTGVRKTQEVFVRELRDVFGDRYDLSQVQYTSKVGKCRLKCALHGWFEKPAEALLKGQGCQLCAREESEGKRLRNLRRKFVEGHSRRLENFLKRARDRHGDRYDYSKVDFRTQHDAVTIVCPTHGPFRQTPATHIQSGCKRCASADLKGLYTDRYFDLWPGEKGRPATLYYVRIRTLNEDFFKVGVTVTSIRARFSGYVSRGRGQITVLRERHTTLHQAFIAEQAILGSHGKVFAYRPAIQNRAARSLVGVTECFSMQLPEELLREHFGS